MRAIFSLPSNPDNLDGATVTNKKKKKKRRHRDDEAEQHSPTFTRNLKNRSSEEKDSHKRRYCDVKDNKHDISCSPQKQGCTNYTDGRSVLPTSHHTAPTNGSAHRHLNGYAGIFFTFKIICELQRHN